MKHAPYPFAALLLACLFAYSMPAFAQSSLTVEKRFIASGTVAAIKPGEITINPTDGPPIVCLVQDRGQRAISLGGRPANAPADIRATGNLPLSVAERGMLVSLSAKSTMYGKTDGEVEEVKALINQEDVELKVDFLQRPEDSKAFANVEVIGRVINLRSQKLQLRVPKAKWARTERMYFKTSQDARLVIDDDSLSRVIPGDRVVKADVIRFSTGEHVIRAVEIELTAERDSLTRDFEDKLDNQFAEFSDEPSPPREVRSAHFVLYTDISDRDAQILLAKLETMHKLVSGYFRAQPRAPIPCYVVRDLSQWTAEQLDPIGIRKIMEPAGVTVSRRLGDAATATVYSCDDHGVVQHEAVHAFCILTFGSAGPTWYAEGMAEMGNYWRPGNLEVNIDPIVINYLVNAKPRKMADIVKAGQITGDSWQAYAWRWALCHLLAGNPNYSKRFKQLGVNLMSGRPDSFTEAFGKYANEISFEYDQFVKNFGNGYRVDLCSWNWKNRAKPLANAKRIKQSIRARGGWQTTKVKVFAGQKYDFVAEDKWNINSETELDADGNAAGAGKLIAAVFSDYQLSEPFELGTRGTFTAPRDGQLVVRCREAWTRLGDNEGKVLLHLRKSKAEKQD